MAKVLIAMSGGVDSSVAAWLMQQEGYDCAGATLRLCDSSLLGAEQNTEDAKSIATKLGMDYYVLDHREDFRKEVLNPFIRCYEEGGTPNPCVNCNRHLKFGILLDKALEMGFDYIATGHYARITQDPDTGRFLLYRAEDESKDQTYFLSCLTQHQLAHTKFPLSQLPKEQVRQIAQEQGYTNANKRDSQDICFIPDGDYISFIKGYTGKEYPTGDFLDLDGNKVGTHSGMLCYTVGQRKGLGIALGEPVYVCDKNVETNTVTVGPNDALFRKALRARDWNWIPFPSLDAPLRVMAKVRYRHSPQPATVFPESDGGARVEFDMPQRAITPGQTVVLYDGDMVVGGGTITEVL